MTAPSEFEVIKSNATNVTRKKTKQKKRKEEKRREEKRKNGFDNKLRRDQTTAKTKKKDEKQREKKLKKTVLKYST